MFKKFFGVLSLIICFVLSAQSVEFETTNSISHMQDDKIYLKPGFVQVAKNGIYISIEGNLVAVDHLELDEDGVFFRAIPDWVTGTCPSCGMPLVLGFCLNFSCPGKS